jgi:hypothetical protein
MPVSRTRTIASSPERSSVTRMLPSGACVLDRVVDQVADDLLEPHRVSIHDDGDRGRNERRLLPPGIERAIDDWQTAGHERIQLDPLRASA